MAHSPAASDLAKQAPGNPATSNIVTVTVTAPKTTPTFTLTANATTIFVGEHLQLTGTLSIQKTGEIDFQIASDNSGFGSSLGPFLITNGAFNIIMQAESVHTYRYKVIWWGDATTNPAESNIVTVTVNAKTTPTFTLAANATTAHVGDRIRATATLSVPKSGTVTVHYSIGSSGFIYQTAATLTNGVCTAIIQVPTTGTWRFYVSWPGDATTNPATSNTVTVTVNP
jgi:hypothetical protein